MRILSYRGLGAVSAVLMGSTSFALATPSGTLIGNTVDLSYQTNGIDVDVPAAATVTFRVDTAVDLLVEGMDAGNSITATRNQPEAVLTYRVENLGNLAFGFDINVDSTGDLGLIYQADGLGGPGTYFVAYGTSPIYDPLNATVYNTAGLINTTDLAENEEFYVYIVGNIGADVMDGNTDTFTVTAQALNAGTNAPVTQLLGQGINGIDIVFADPGQDGQESDAETLVIAAPELTSTKLVEVISENRDGLFNCATGLPVAGAEAFIPGACLEYTISVTNAAGASTAATDLVLTDPLPANVTYVASDAGTFDDVLVAGTTVTGELATLAPGATAAFTIRVTVN